MIGNLHLGRASVKSAAGNTHVLKYTFFNSRDPIVRLALLSRDLLIWGKLHNDLSLIPYAEGQHSNNAVLKCHVPALSLKICPSKDRPNRASCSSVLNARYARDGIVSLFNLSPHSS